MKSRIPFAVKFFLITLCLVVVGFVAIERVVSTGIPEIGSEFHVEGFQKAKIIGISNSRAIVVLTNNAGHNSYEEMSLNTVEMFKSISHGE